MERAPTRRNGRRSVVLGRRFERALTWSCRLHRRQRRKGTDVPYLSHLLGVTSLVLDDGGTEREAIAALLHDAVEDCGVRPKRIRKRFGRKVERIVLGCTDDFDARGGKRRRAKNWRKRKERYLDHLRDPSTPESVLRVSAADKLHNARSIVVDLRRHGPETWQRFHAGAVDQLWYYRSLTVVFGYRLPGMLSDELRATVRDMESLAGWWFDVGDPQDGRRAPGSPTAPGKLRRKQRSKPGKGKQGKTRQDRSKKRRSRS